MARNLQIIIPYHSISCDFKSQGIIFSVFEKGFQKKDQEAKIPKFLIGG